MRSYEVTDREDKKNDPVKNGRTVELVVEDNMAVSGANNEIGHPGVSLDSGLDSAFETSTRADQWLVAAKHEHITKKDFGVEIRGSMDIENYLDHVAVLLDLPLTNVEGILETMLQEMLQRETKSDLEEAKKIFFMEDVQQLSKIIQSTCETDDDGGGVDYDQSWLCSFGAVPNMQKRRIAIARLSHATNFGRTCQEVKFLILIAAPAKEKSTKTELEASRTFATLFSNIDLRRQLLDAENEEEFKKLMVTYMSGIQKLHTEKLHSRMSKHTSIFEETSETDLQCKFPIGRGIINDLKRRIPLYFSDYTDGILGKGTIHKTIACVFYLYFACLLPAIAIGVVNEKNTNYMDVRKGIYAQAIGGLVYGLFSGQPLVILRTTVPIAIYLQVIAEISTQFEIDFRAFYACVGLWCSLFTLIYAFTGLSKIMKWSTRSTEEIFAMFISIAFIVDALKDTLHDFEDCYIGHHKESHLINNVSGATNNTTPASETKVPPACPKLDCGKDSSLLYLLLALGTLWVGLFMYNFTKTPYLNRGKREILADYSLPAAVIFGAFFGSFVFRDVYLHEFCANPLIPVFEFPPLHLLQWGGILGGLGLGLSLSLLFFMDHNISAAMVQSPNNKLKKGPSLHWDLVVVSLLNIGLSLCGIPWVHGALPHSPLHVHALADTEERVDQGHVHQRVVRVRETRVSTLLAHVLMALSVLMMPIPLQLIPRAVLNGLFLIMAITALDHIQFFERILLLFTEQAAYPPNHYIRSVPQRKIHLFTVIQFIQLAVLCGFGFAPIPYLKMCFPVLLMIMLPIRHKLVPLMVPEKFLASMDGHI